MPPSEAFAFAVLDPRSPQAVARITPFWREVWEGAPQWLLRAGQYDLTPDHRPLIGATDVPGLFVYCGTSGHGVMTAAGGARRLAESLAGRLAADHPFAPGRRFEERERDVL